MDEKLGDRVIAFLRRNPTVHELAREFDLSLTDAYMIQEKYMLLWQAMGKVRFGK